MSLSLCDKLPVSVKQPLQSCNISVLVADNQNVKVLGVTQVKGRTPHGTHWFPVYIFECTSHPFIIGTDYMIEKGIVLDFGANCNLLNGCMKSKLKVRSMKPVTVEPNTELVIHGKVPSKSLYGVQGLLSAHVNILRRGLLLARSVNTISADKTIPFKIMNPGNDSVFIPKGMVLADFAVLDSSYDIVPFPMCNNIRDISQCQGETDCQKSDDFDAFCANFDFSGAHVLTNSQIEKLEKCLYAHKNVFVTKENPQLGFTNLVQHEIHPKPNFIPKYQRPYRLPPDKREVLRTQLDELLSQGVISPVSETDSLLIFGR